MTTTVSITSLVVALALSAPLTGMVGMPVQAAGAPEPAAVAAPSLPAITVSAVKMVQLTDRVYAGGLVQAVQLVQVAPLIEGQPIEALMVDVGDRVTAGQVLARLSTTTLELSRSQLLASVASARATIAQAGAQVLEAEASADEANRVAARNKLLLGQGNVSQAAADQVRSAAISATARVTVAQQSLEAARAQLTNVEAQLANVALSLTRTDVIAPAAGKILTRNAQVGSIASAAGQPMFTLVRDGALELRAEIAERDLARLAAGQTARIAGVGLLAPMTGAIRMVEPSIDVASRLGYARITLDDPAAARAGMYADAEIVLASRMALAVPVSAISAGTEGATVMRIIDGVAERVVVQTGIRDSGMVEIVAGLAEGDSVVTKAGAFVRPGDRIQPVAAETN